MNKFAEKKCSIAPRGSQGHTLLPVIILLTLSLLTAAGLLQLTSNESRSSLATYRRTRDYSECEASLHEAISWLRQNSTELVSSFRADQFYVNFRRTTPSIGSNDSSVFNLPTQIKAAGTTDSLLLVSKSTLGRGVFPTVPVSPTVPAFNMVAAFAASDIGKALVRITLVNAVPINPALDYGNPPGSSPSTDFLPVFRIDAMTSLTSGAHLRAYVTATPEKSSSSFGFYGDEWLDIRQNCDSYQSAVGGYSVATRRAECSMGGSRKTQLRKGKIVYGSLVTTSNAKSNSIVSGKVCRDFQSGCPNPGVICAGPTCRVPPLTGFEPWSNYCPPKCGDLNVTSRTSLAIAGGTPGQNCWDTVTIAKNSSLVLGDTQFPYYIRRIIFANSTTSLVEIAPNTSGGKVVLNVEELGNNTFSTRQFINAYGPASRFTLNYLGSRSFSVESVTSFMAVIKAPLAQITMKGNGDFFGSITARRLLLRGKGALHYDESVMNNSLQSTSDLKFEVQEIGQVYR